MSDESEKKDSATDNSVSNNVSGESAGKSQSKDQRKRLRAIALEYHNPDELPRILATGAGEIAQKILELAASHGIPVQEDDSLTSILAKLEVGSAISPQSYKLVAEVLAFLYHTDKEWREKHQILKDVMEK